VTCAGGTAGGTCSISGGRSTRAIRPSRRICVSYGVASTMVFKVPRLLVGSLLPKARVSWAASGNSYLSSAAWPSVGTKSNPTPGITTIPAFWNSAARAKIASNTAISPVLASGARDLYRTIPSTNDSSHGGRRAIGAALPFQAPSEERPPAALKSMKVPRSATASTAASQKVARSPQA
jgi:hypothetical protein